MAGVDPFSVVGEVAPHVDHGGAPTKTMPVADDCVEKIVLHDRHSLLERQISSWFCDNGVITPERLPPLFPSVLRRKWRIQRVTRWPDGPLGRRFVAWPRS